MLDPGIQSVMCVTPQNWLADDGSVIACQILSGVARM
jgi:hypothetical protein